MVRVIKELRPTWVVGENVAGIVRMALPDILSELEACGYRTRTFLIPACAVGARHRRYRVAIVGYSEHNGLSSTAVAGGVETAGRGQQKGKKTPGEFAGTSESGNGQDMADAKSQLKRRLHIRKESEQSRFSSGGEDVCDTAGKGLSDRTSKPMGGQGTSEPESERPMRRPTESVLGGMADGIPNGVDGDLDFIINHYWDDEPDIPRIATGIEHRVDRLKCLGNAVVPQQFYPIFKAIAEVENLSYDTE